MPKKEIVYIYIYAKKDNVYILYSISYWFKCAYEPKFDWFQPFH